MPQQAKCDREGSSKTASESSGAATTRFSISIILPTFRRPTDLARCLEALEQQTLPPHEVAIVVRDIDAESRTFVEGYRGSLPVKILSIVQPGQVAALNLGIEQTSGDIIAITDDDTAPRPDWLERIHRHFLADPGVGGVGGRDNRYEDGKLVTGGDPVVGQLQWFGRNTGGFHLGVGGPRLTGHLRGANMSFRRTAVGNLRFDSRLLGGGAQTSNDWAFGNAVRRAGWKLLYDPAVQVEHYCATRVDGDDRTARDAVETYRIVFNETLTTLEDLDLWQWIPFGFWSCLVGTQKSPGLAQVLRFALRGQSGGAATLLAAWRARRDAWRTACRASSACTFLRYALCSRRPAPPARGDLRTSALKR